MSNSPSTAYTRLALTALPPIHRGPFDRLILAQALTEGLTLLTADKLVANTLATSSS